MFALIYDRNGQEQARWPIADHELLNPDVYAERYSTAIGYPLKGSKPEAIIPDGTEDYRVTLQEEPGSVVCWTSRNYLLMPELRHLDDRPPTG